MKVAIRPITSLDDIRKIFDEAEEEVRLKKIKIIFLCPVCGCDKYEGVFQPSPFDTIGDSVHCKEIECGNCHVRLGIEALCKG